VTAAAPLEIDGPAAPPRSNGELVFTEPWESRAFGLALTLYDADVFEWSQFQAALVAHGPVRHPVPLTAPVMPAGAHAGRVAVWCSMTSSLVLAVASSALPERAVTLLTEHQRAQQREREMAGNRWADHGFVFASETGRPVDPRADNREWSELLAAAHVREARLHDARHTAATVLLVLGVS
jgi:hypothetical protein